MGPAPRGRPRRGGRGGRPVPGAEDFDFLAWNHLLDAGARWADAAAGCTTATRTGRPRRWPTATHFALSIAEPIDANVAVLRDLHAAGVPLFALTNWSDELFPQALARYDFLGLFDDIVVSGAEGLAKPDPAIFERLRERIGRPLEACVFVDDSAANVAAAAAAGLDAIRFTDDVAAAASAARRAACRSDVAGARRRRSRSAPAAARSTSSSETPSRSASKASLPPRIPNSRLVQSR